MKRVYNKGRTDILIMEVTFLIEFSGHKILNQRMFIHLRYYLFLRDPSIDYNHTIILLNYYHMKNTYISLL